MFCCGTPRRYACNDMGDSMEHLARRQEGPWGRYRCASCGLVTDGTTGQRLGYLPPIKKS